MSVPAEQLKTKPYAWMDDPRVRCKFFYGMYPNNPSSLVAQSKAICNGEPGKKACEMRETCLHWAIDHEEQFGVWGGTSERERRKIQRARRRNHNPAIYRPEDIRFTQIIFVEHPVVFVNARVDLSVVRPLRSAG